MKHNKKRNTAFLYEVLLREGTKAMIGRSINFGFSSIASMIWASVSSFPL